MNTYRHMINIQQRDRSHDLETRDIIKSIFYEVPQFFVNTNSFYSSISVSEQLLRNRGTLWNHLQYTEFWTMQKIQ